MTERRKANWELAVNQARMVDSGPFSSREPIPARVSFDTDYPYGQNDRKKIRRRFFEMHTKRNPDLRQRLWTGLLHIPMQAVGLVYEFDNWVGLGGTGNPKHLLGNHQGTRHLGGRERPFSHDDPFPLKRTKAYRDWRDSGVDYGSVMIGEDWYPENSEPEPNRITTARRNWHYALEALLPGIRGKLTPARRQWSRNRNLAMWGENMLKVYALLSSYFQANSTFNTEPANNPGIDFENDGEFWAYKDYPELRWDLRDLRHQILNYQWGGEMARHWPEDWTHLLDLNTYWEKDTRLTSRPPIHTLYGPGY